MLFNTFGILARELMKMFFLKCMCFVVGMLHVSFCHQEVILIVGII